MPRTDKEIFEYMRYYNTTTNRRWAFENLCWVERKTPEEIRAICDKFRNKEEQEVAKPKFSDELKEAVLADKASGMKTGDVAERHGLTAKQVENICTVYKQKLKASEEAEHVETEAVSETKQDEACPGQINDDVAAKPINVFVALLAMQQFINAIAEGAEITEAAASAGNDAHVSFSFGGTDYGLELKRLDN